MRRIPVADEYPHVGQAVRVWLQRHGWASAARNGSRPGGGALDPIIIHATCAGAGFSSRVAPAAPCVAAGTGI